MAVIRAAGRVLAVWAAVLPALALLDARNLNRDWQWLAGLQQMVCFAGPFELPFTAVLGPCLVLAALGLSLATAGR